MFTLSMIQMLGQKRPTNNFKFKNCLFGVTSVVKNHDKERYVYSGYGITFDRASSWSFDNDTNKNVMMAIKMAMCMIFQSITVLLTNLTY